MSIHSVLSNLGEGLMMLEIIRALYMPGKCAAPEPYPRGLARLCNLSGFCDEVQNIVSESDLSESKTPN